jgi:hypothetical protein
MVAPAGLLTYTEGTGRGVGATLDFVNLFVNLRVTLQGSDLYPMLFQHRPQGKVSVGQERWMDVIRAQICRICGFSSRPNSREE